MMLLHRVLLTLIVFSTLVAGQQPIARDPRYPAQWWTPVIDPKKPDWEILPQEAGPGEVILSKRHELGLLSNFAPTPFVFHGKRYASLEGFWQMMKYPEGPRDPRAKFPGLEWKHTRAQVAQMVSFEANKAGALASENMTKMGITWVSFEGKHFEYKPAVPGEHYKLIVAATCEGETESGSEKSSAQHRRSSAETRSSSGGQRAGGVALLRDPDPDSDRVAEAGEALTRSRRWF